MSEGHTIIADLKRRLRQDAAGERDRRNGSQGAGKVCDWLWNVHVDSATRASAYDRMASQMRRKPFSNPAISASGIELGPSLSARSGSG